MKNKFKSSVLQFENQNIEEYKYHNLLRWFGKLPPELVKTLIEMYSKKGDLVLAPFAGSGTIPLECLKTNRDCIACDINPLSLLLNSIKTNPIKLNKKKLIKIFENIEIKNIKTSDYENKWFYKESFQTLKAIKKTIDESKLNKKEKNLLLSALVSITKRSSKVDSRCINHIVVDKNKKREDVLLKYIRNLEEKIDLLNELYSKYKLKNKIILKLEDAKKMNSIKNESIDFIIAHPPYLGNVDYTNIYQLENYLLGFNKEKSRDFDLSTNSKAKYLESMKEVLISMKRVLKKDKRACLIIGDNRKDGNIVPCFSYLLNYAIEELDLKLEDIFIWVLKGKAGINIKRHGNHIDHNYVLIFKK